MDITSPHPRGHTRRVFFIAALLLYAVSVHTHTLLARDSFFRGSPESVRINAPQTYKKQLAQLAVRCKHVLDRYLGQADSRREIRIVMLREGKTAISEDRRRVRINANTSRKELVALLVEAMFVKRCRAWTDNKWTPSADNLGWLISALTYEILYVPKIRGVRLRPTYRVLRRQFRTERFPDVDTVLETQISFKHPLVYRLYSEHCHLFLHLVLSTRDSGNRERFLKQILYNIRKGDSTADVIAAQLEENNVLDTDQSLQQWYAEKALPFSLKGRACLHDEEVKRRLKKLRNVRIRRPQADGKITHTRVSLAQLPEVIESEDSSSAVGLTSLINDFHWLARESNPYFRPALLKYVTALTVLEKGQVHKFHRTRKQARTMFRKRWRRKKKISEFLDSVARRKLPIEQRFPFFLEALEETEKRYRTTPDPVSQLLDRVQKKRSSNAERMSEED